LFVKDIVRANQLVTGDTGGCEIFNLGWGKEVTDQQVFEAVRDALAAKVEPIYSERRPGEIDKICLDASKVERELGWRPEVLFLDGVKRTVESGKG
jgi:UDP-glucose 4-epimerase